MVTREDVLVSAPHPPEFRRRAVELAREGAKPVAELPNLPDLWWRHRSAPALNSRTLPTPIGFTSPSSASYCLRAPVIDSRAYPPLWPTERPCMVPDRDVWCG